MSELDFSFEIPQFETILTGLKYGQSLSAPYFLNLMEAQSEDEMDDAFSILEGKNILLDVNKLPKDFGVGESSVRLRREEQLVKEGSLLENLNEHDPLRLYLEEVISLECSSDFEQNLNRLRAGDGNAIPEIANAMLPMVTKIAFDYTGHGCFLLDLIQEGSLGLWKALQEDLPEDAETFFVRRISIAMANFVTSQARQNGIGAKLKQGIGEFQSADQRLLISLGRNPTLEEIAQEMNITMERASIFQEMLDASRLLANAIPATKTDEEQENLAVEDTAYFQMRQRIQELLSSLSEEDAQILNLRFGLEGKPPMSADEVGHFMHLTPEEVTMREASALALLRNHTEK